LDLTDARLVATQSALTAPSPSVRKWEPHVDRSAAPDFAEHSSSGRYQRAARRQSESNALSMGETIRGNRISFDYPKLQPRVTTTTAIHARTFGPKISAETTDRVRPKNSTSPSHNRHLGALTYLTEATQMLPYFRPPPRLQTAMCVPPAVAHTAPTRPHLYNHATELTPPLSTRSPHPTEPTMLGRTPSLTKGEPRRKSL